MLATQKISLRISPEENTTLAMLAARLGRTKSGTLRWLVMQASKEIPEQKALIVKGKRQRRRMN